MLSMFAMASSRWDPSVSADGSLKLAPSAAGADGAGEGVAGAFDVVVFEAGAGAAGGAGVCAVAGAGVDGAFKADDEAAGAALGFGLVSLYPAVLGLP
jgi:hypothetical protein